VKQSFTFSCGLLAKLSAAILALFCKKREWESLQNPEFFSGETNNNENSSSSSFFLSCLEFETRVARFIMLQHTKTGKIYENIPNGRNIDQMDTKYTNIFDCKALQNLPKWGFRFKIGIPSGNPVGNSLDKNLFHLRTIVTPLESIKGD
jgi:hypothetical protein